VLITSGNLVITVLKVQSLGQLRSTVRCAPPSYHGRSRQKTLTIVRRAGRSIPCPDLR
jgi:hypothetical protein